jgi:hypothetical protein
MKICLTLDDVLRNKTVQLGKIYKKYINPDIDLETLDFSTNNYEEIFGFKSRKEFNKFLYEDYVFEIFGEATACEKTLDKKLNLWLLEQENNDDLQNKLQVSISNPREFNASIGCTCFFLSKMATKIREMFFPADSNDIWEKCDVLITADPGLLKSKPEGKTSIKISNDYNEDCEADYTYDSLANFLLDKDIIPNLDKKY